MIARVLPQVEVLAGTAEELPLAAASADVACAGQAFHWFDFDRALDEIARVLRPGGVLIAAWNMPTDDHSWYDAVADYLHTANADWLPADAARLADRVRGARGLPRPLRDDVPARAAARLRVVRAPARHTQRDRRAAARAPGRS